VCPVVYVRARESRQEHVPSCRAMVCVGRLHGVKGTPLTSVLHARQPTYLTPLVISQHLSAQGGDYTSNIRVSRLYSFPV